MPLRDLRPGYVKIPRRNEMPIFRNASKCPVIVFKWYKTENFEILTFEDP